MGLINFWGQKSKLDELQDDLANMKLYVTHVSGCIEEIDACWIGNRDKQKVVNVITSHLHLVNKSNSNLNTFKQTATFVLIKMHELGSLVGLTPPFVSQICLPGICSNFRLNPKIQINTTALRLVADKIEDDRKHLDDTSFAINDTRNIIDNIILNLFGLNNLLRAIEKDVAEQKLENQRIVSGIRRICDLYESTENRLKGKIEALTGLGTTVVVDPPITPTPTPPVTNPGGTSSGVEVGKIRKITQQWSPKGGNPDFDQSVWGTYDSMYACGVASASMALSSLGIDMLPNVICKNNDYPGNSPESMNFGRQGYSCFDSRFDGIDIDTALKNYREDPAKYSPPIIGVENNGIYGRDHFVVCTGKDANGNYKIQDPGSLNENRTYNNIIYQVNQYYV